MATSTTNCVVSPSVFFSPHNPKSKSAFKHGQFRCACPEVLPKRHPKNNNAEKLHYPFPSVSKCSNLCLPNSLQRQELCCTVRPRLFNSQYGTLQCLRFNNSRRQLQKFCRVKSSDAERNLGSEGMIMDEETLQQKLEIAIKDENYSLAAKLRDDLRLLHQDSKTAVLAANSQFYDAFRNGDLAAMHSIWARGDNICCVHPGAGSISGYDLVMDSWEVVCGADHEFPLQIELKDVLVYVKGDVGYVTCLEVIKTKGSSWGKQVAINVFERIDGQWRICIHHASHVDL